MEFIRVKNCSDKIVKFRPHFQRPTKSAPPVYATLSIRPGVTAPVVLPRNAVTGSQQWATVKKFVSLIRVKAFTGFVGLKAKAESIRAKVKLHVKGKRTRMKELVISKARSTTIHLPSLENRQVLRDLQRKRKITLEPLPYIAPYYRGGSAGSYGDEDVYVCWDCGGPIVFRGSPPTPIHI